MTEREVIEGLSNAIIATAVEDWRSILQGKSIPGESLDSIRAFFKSELAQLLCGKVAPLYILERLEEERRSLL